MKFQINVHQQEAAKSKLRYLYSASVHPQAEAALQGNEHVSSFEHDWIVTQHSHPHSPQTSGSMGKIVLKHWRAFARSGSKSMHQCGEVV